jgi:hypothetical protein
MGCRPERFFCRPERSEGVLRRLRASGGQKKESAPREDMDGLSPRALFLSSRTKWGVPRRYAPREDKKESVPREDKKESVPREDRDGLSPRALFFVAPSEVGGASLSLGRTKRGSSAGQREGARQEGVGDFFEIARGLKFGLAIIFFA